MNAHAIILAAGRGSRMQVKHETPKSILPLAGKPATSYVLEKLKSLEIPVSLVVKHKQDEVKDALGDWHYIVQGERSGTGAALQSALSALDNIDGKDIIVLNADDSAFLTRQTIETFLMIHRDSENVLTVLTVEKDDPTGLGRVLKVADQVIAIREEKDATDDEKQVKEINTGMFCFQGDWLKKAVNELTPSAVTGEYYITQLVEIAVSNNQKVGSFVLPEPKEWFGFNTPEQYTEAQKYMNERVSL